MKARYLRPKSRRSAGCAEIHQLKRPKWPTDSMHVTIFDANVSAANPLSVNAGFADRRPFNVRRLLMFSGGRDSTLAAIRMAREEQPLALVTVSSSHLFGIERVKARLRELVKYLDRNTPWLHVRQPMELRTDTSFYVQTCLPCHHAYVVVSGVLARFLQADRLAFGYAGYQRDWPEQTPLATERLAAVLGRHGIRLELPVYDVSSKEEVMAELLALGVSTEALEQKCSRQVTNVTLPDAQLHEQVRLWEGAIDRSLTLLNDIELDIIERSTVGDFQ